MLRSLLLLLLLATPAQAQVFEVRFDLSLRGVTGGQMVITAIEAGDRYNVAGRAKGTGLMGQLMRYSYEGRVEGRTDLRPDRYVEIESGRRGRIQTTTTWSDGTVTSAIVAPPPEPEPWAIDPVGLEGVMDPLSALYGIVRPVEEGLACNRTYELFDGQRRSRLRLSAMEEKSEGLICTAQYERIAGYPPEEMEETDGRVFTLILERIDGRRVQVVEMQAETSVGIVALRRR